VHVGVPVSTLHVVCHFRCLLASATLSVACSRLYAAHCAL
jgi:hypothetical protein